MIVEEIVTRLNGAMLKKAEMENDYLEFYTNVFAKLAMFSFSERIEILELFGTMGG